MVRAFVGTNWFGIQTAVKKIEQDFLQNHDSLSLIRLHGPDTEINEVTEALGGVSLFSPEKLVILSDVSENKVLCEGLEALITKLDEQVSVIIVEKAIDKRSSYFKFLKRLPGYKEYTELTEQELIRWVEEYVVDHEAKLSRQDAEYLVDRVGANQTLLEKELHKLINYDKKITRETIAALTEQSLRSTIFQLIDTAFAGDKERALRLYEEQRSLRVEPQAILGMLIWQMHAVTVALAGGSRSSQAIASESGLSPYVVGKAQNIAQRMGASCVRSLLELLRSIDIASKTKAYDLDDALRYAILTIH